MSHSPSLVPGYPPFLGRRVATYLGNGQGKASGVSRNRPWWIPESWRSDPGISSSEGIPGSEDLAGAEDCVRLPPYVSNRLVDELIV